MVQHFVIQLPNRPGELAHLARALAARGINIVHVAAGGAGSEAFAYLETDRFDDTREVLSGMGYDYLAGKTIVVECRDEPGALAGLAEELAAVGVNIEGVMTASHAGGKVDVALTVDDVDKARAALDRDKVVAA
ncbi:MAG TPA: ACT domain-containing protein [Candidatus Limnocylindrales bacterium]|nr:ACT domain-containing protein [Candidatus Limnocylindrales bacterium]